MALHQFKIKHYATSGRHENSVNDSLENDNTHTSCTKQGDNNTPILRIQRRSSDPILLYKPSEVMVCPVQPYKDEEEEEGEEDLFRACHNDLIRDMRSNYDASQSHSSNAIVAEQYYEVKQKYPKKRTELPLQEVHADSIVRPTHHSHRAQRGPLRENEHKEMLPCHSPHNVHSYQNSDIHFYPNHESPSPSWNETSPFAYYSSQEPLEVEKLQYFYHQMATHMQPPIICPVTGHHFPVHLLKTLKGVHHSSNSIGEFLPQASAFVHSPNYEFQNAKRMLVEGVKLVCDGARETMDKMEFKNKTRMSYNGGIPGVECIPSLDGSYQDICGKLNYIQSAFLQLAECNDPEMLNEARRIIPIDLLHRLLQQLQEHSLEGQEPQGIT